VVTESSPPDFSWTADRGKTKVGLVPPKNGTIFRIVDFVPTTQKIESMDINTMMKVVGDHAPAKGLPPRHPMMHRNAQRRLRDHHVGRDRYADGRGRSSPEDGRRRGAAGDQPRVGEPQRKTLRVAFILMDSREP